MTRISLILVLFSCICCKGYAQQQEQQTALISHFADLGIIYPITSNGVNAPCYNNTISLQALAGASGGITGGAAAGIANIIKKDVYGTTLAGIGNTIGGNANGALFSGIYTIVRKDMTGVQFAGICNITTDVNGYQTAGIFNKAEKVNGIQIAGIFNRSTTIRGVQLSGLINRATKVKGVQLSGLINLADSSDYPIGFINLIKQGDKNIMLSTDASLNTMLSFQSGGRVLYGSIGLGYKLNSDYHLFLLEVAIGAHLLNIKDVFLFNTEAAQLVASDFTKGHLYRYSLRMLPEIKLTNRLSILAGPSANLILDYSNQKFSGKTTRYFWTTEGRNGHFIGSNIGFIGRLKFML